MKLHKLDKALATNFILLLLKWNKYKNTRQMPWKGEKDPYRIWLSEIILQQTRVEQGLQYYNRFIRAFPTVHNLADASEKQVLQLWEGLGYYSRCINLITTAKFISKEKNGNFPDDYTSVLNLKGVGPYTAAAICSFAYNLPYAVIDGNVLRVLSRIFKIHMAVDTNQGKNVFNTIAQSILPGERAAEYNQAIMDFGSTICSPVPKCEICFFIQNCKAFKVKQQHLLPIKTKKLKIRARWFNYIILNEKKKYAISQRKKRDIWQNLYEFYLIETNEKAPEEIILDQLKKELNCNFVGAFSFSSLPPQRLTHQTIHYKFIQVQLQESTLDNSFVWVSAKTLITYPFPKTLKEFIKTQLIINNSNAGKKFDA